MARLNQIEAVGRNVLAFLDMLAWAEGTSRSRHTKDDGYDIVVDGIDSPKVFSDYSKHPNILVTVNSRGLKSTAAGRYQLLNRWYEPYRKLLGLKDFGPESQDKIAIQQIRERRALNDIKAGRIEQAIEKCRNIWARLPGAGYGQPEHKLAELIKQYRLAGGHAV